MKEPIWRQILIWGSLVYFLLIPALVIFYSIFDFNPVENDRSSFISQFHFAITAIVAAMAGLNSYDRAKANGHDDKSKYLGSAP